MLFENVGVLGAGQMGAGIAQVAAMHSRRVLLVDVAEAQLHKAQKNIKASLEKLAQKGILGSQSAEAIFSHISFSTASTDFAKSAIVIEAVAENLNIKKEIFQNLDRICPAETVFCSNTSSISITQLAAFTKRPDRFAGMHFMNPVPLMKLVEGIRGLQTSEKTFSQVKEFASDLGKTFVESRDLPGFVVNRILMPMINEAVFALYEGIASCEDIDQAMKLGTNQPMGPLTLADFIGLDTCLAIMEVLHSGLGEDKYRPCPLLRKYVEAGWLGKKTGRGFYSYT